jgi:hypothetical protein
MAPRRRGTRSFQKQLQTLHASTHQHHAQPKETMQSDMHAVDTCHTRCVVTRRQEHCFQNSMVRKALNASSMHTQTDVCISSATWRTAVVFTDVHCHHGDSQSLRRSHIIVRPTQQNCAVVTMISAQNLHMSCCTAVTDGHVWGVHCQRQAMQEQTYMQQPCSIDTCSFCLVMMTRLIYIQNTIQRCAVAARLIESL